MKHEAFTGLDVCNFSSSLLVKELTSMQGKNTGYETGVFLCRQV